MEALDGFRWEAAFPTWLSGIALNYARELLRKRKRRNEMSTDGMLEFLAGGPRPDHGRRLEEKTVAAFKGRGLIGGHAGRSGHRTEPASRFGRDRGPLHPAWWAAGIAAALALFFGGLAAV